MAAQKHTNFYLLFFVFLLLRRLLGFARGARVHRRSRSEAKAKKKQKKTNKNRTQYFGVNEEGAIGEKKKKTPQILFFHLPSRKKK